MTSLAIAVALWFLGIVAEQVLLELWRRRRSYGDVVRILRTVGLAVMALAATGALIVGAGTQVLELREERTQTCFARLGAYAATALVGTASGRTDEPLEELRQAVVDDLIEDLDACDDD